MGSITLVLEATGPDGGPVIVHAVDPIGWGLDADSIGRPLDATFPEIAVRPEIRALLEGGAERDRPRWSVGCQGPIG